MSRDDDAKRIILARRARFLEMTLAALASCSPARTTESPGAELVVPPLPARGLPSLDAGHRGSSVALEDAAALELEADAEPGHHAVVRVCLSIIVPQKVTFLPQGPKITPASSAVLDAIAQTLAANPRIQQLEIEGHTDSTEPASVGQTRADAVLQELVKRGVDPGRLSTSNAGATKPIVPNTTAEGRAKNRRVELLVR